MKCIIKKKKKNRIINCRGSIKERKHAKSGSFIWSTAHSQNVYMIVFSMSTSSVMGPEQKALSLAHPGRKLE